MSRIRASVLAILSGCLAAVEPSLTNPGFEGPSAALPAGAHISGTIAEGWGDNSSWADVDVEYAIDTKNPHSGKAAQVINLKRFGGGLAQFTQAVRFKAGDQRRFSVWLRGQPGQTVQLQLRQAGAPYQTHGKTDVSLSAEWRQYHVQTILPRDEDGLVMINAGQPVRFAIDDAKLEDLTSLSNSTPPRQGNLLTGGSFETIEPSFGWNTRQQGDTAWFWSDPRHRTDAVGMFGSRSLRIDVQAGGKRGETFSPVFVPNGNRMHTASAWMKADHANVSVSMCFQGGGRPWPTAETSHQVSVGTEWQRFTFSENIPYLDWSRLLFNTDPEGGPVTLWIDGVMVEEGSTASESYKPAAPLELTLSLDRPGHILHDGQTAAARLEVAPAPPAGAILELSVEDLIGGTVKLPALSLPADKIALPELPGRPRGMFKLHAVVRSASGAVLSAPTELVWSRLPKPRELAAEKSSFGIHIPLAPDYIALARAVGMRWIRFHDTCMIGKWPIAEPEAGKWEFYDTQVDAAHQAGLAILGMLDGAPRRVSTKPRNGDYWRIYHLPDQPEALDQWRTYVRTVTSHYKGRIDAWEVWNEPWGLWWTQNGGSPELYATFMKTAYSEAKQANPKSTILGIDTYRGADWTDRVLASSGTDCFDAFSFHDYNDALYGGSPSFAKQQVDTFAAAMTKVGTAKPQWNTEGGLAQAGSWYAPVTGGLPARDQLAFAARYDICMLAAGVKASIMYSIMANPAMGETECHDTEFDRAVKPVLAARAVLAFLIDGVGVPVYSQPEKGVDCHTFPAENGRRVVVWWTNDGESHEIAVPAGAEVLDVLGSPLAARRGRVQLTHEPVYMLVR